MINNIFERLAQNPGGMQQQDYQNWNQMVGSAPQGQFGQQAYQAIQQVPPQEYFQHTQPGVGGTDPFGALMPQQRSGLAQSLIGALMGQGVGQPQIGQIIGMGGGMAGNQGSFNPSQMSPQQMAALAQYMQQNHPQALGQVAQQYQSQPDVLHSLLGNKALMMLAAGLGAKYLQDRSQGQPF